MKKRGGVFNNIVSIVGALVLFGIFLAALSQFGGDLGAMFQWVLNGAWNIVTSVRDSVASWDTFQRIF